MTTTATPRRGILAVWNDVDPMREEEMNRWYQSQHLPERLAVPGFLSARRGIAAAGAPRYFAWYETASLAVLSSAEYLQRLQQPTEWTRSIMPAFRAMNRTVGECTLDVGGGVGGATGTTALAPRAEERARLRERIAALAPGLLTDHRLQRLQLVEADASLSDVPTHERTLRPGGDAMHDWVVAIDGFDADAVGAACERVAALAGAAARPAAIYRLLCRCG